MSSPLMHSEGTRALCRRYFEAWTHLDRSAVAAVLAEDFRFEAGTMAVDGRDVFLDAGAFPADATTVMLAEAYDGDAGFQLYESTRGGHTVRIVEQLTVRGDVIARSRFVADMAAFAAFAGIPGAEESDGAS